MIPPTKVTQIIESATRAAAEKQGLVWDTMPLKYQQAMMEHTRFILTHAIEVMIEAMIEAGPEIGPTEGEPK